MASPHESRLPEILTRFEQPLLQEWIRLQAEAPTRRRDLVSDADLAEQSRAFLAAFRKASSQSLDPRSPAWQEARAIVGEISGGRARLGFSPSETATFVFSLKQPLFARLRDELGGDAQALAEATWAATTLLDGLGLFTTEVYQKGREEVIARQQEELLELSTPVIKVWEGVLVLPMIGTLDSARTQIVMESLLQRIVETGSAIAIIDITGVPTVDTVVAQHLLKTVTAIRLMGADCIISGIRPQIAQTIVHLGIDLHGVLTKANLADALSVALKRSGFNVSRGASAVDAATALGAGHGANGSATDVLPASRRASSASHAAAGA